MKRLRFALAFLAVLTALTFTFSDTIGRNDPPCVYQQQYYKLGYGFQPAGTEGVSYACIHNPFTCTYYKPDPVLEPNNYVPCKIGFYFPIEF